MDSILEQFINQECTAHVRGLLEDAISNTTVQYTHFEFNRFEITIKRKENIVVLEDVLDATEEGVMCVPLEEFVAAITVMPKS